MSCFVYVSSALHNWCFFACFQQDLTEKKLITENIYGPNQRAGGVSEERKNNTMKEVCSAFAVALDMSSPGP